jgi:hypothetical protein
MHTYVLFVGEGGVLSLEIWAPPPHSGEGGGGENMTTIH